MTRHPQNHPASVDPTRKSAGRAEHPVRSGVAPRQAMDVQFMADRNGASFEQDQRVSAMTKRKAKAAARSRTIEWVAPSEMFAERQHD